MQKITPFLWFDDQAEEAFRILCLYLKDSKIVSLARYGEGSPGKPGTVMTATFQLAGQELVALNGGLEFKFTEAISFYVHSEVAGGSGLFLGKAHRRWRRRTVRLA